MGAAFVSKGERRATGFTTNIQGMYSTGQGLGSIQKQSCFKRQHGRTEQFSECPLWGHSSRSQFGHGKSKASPWKKVQFWLIILHVGHCEFSVLLIVWLREDMESVGARFLSWGTYKEIHRINVKCWWKNNKRPHGTSPLPFHSYCNRAWGYSWWWEIACVIPHSIM